MRLQLQCARYLYTCIFIKQRNRILEIVNRVHLYKIYCNFLKIVNSLHPLRDFPKFDFHVKIMCFACSLCVNICCHPDNQDIFNLRVRNWLLDQSCRKISPTNWYFHWDLSPYIRDLSPQNLPQKVSSRSTMAPWQRIVNGAISKGKVITTTGGTTPPPTNNLHHAEDTDSFSL